MDGEKPDLTIAVVVLIICFIFSVLSSTNEDYMLKRRVTLLEQSIIKVE